MKNKGAIESYIPCLCLDNVCNGKWCSTFESRWYRQKLLKKWRDIEEWIVGAELIYIR